MAGLVQCATASRASDLHWLWPIRSQEETENCSAQPSNSQDVQIQCIPYFVQSCEIFIVPGTEDLHGLNFRLQWLCAAGACASPTAQPDLGAM